MEKLIIIFFVIVLFLWIYAVRSINKMKREAKEREGGITYGKYDFSTKPYEMLFKEYVFLTASRKLDYQTGWKHFKYYNTLEGAKDAIKEYRKHSAFLDYRAASSLRRFKIQKRTI